MSLVHLGVKVSQHFVLVGHFLVEVFIFILYVGYYASYLIQMLVLVFEHLLLQIKNLSIALSSSVLELSIFSLHKRLSFQVCNVVTKGTIATCSVNSTGAALTLKRFDL